ncbi:MAG: hypothetical protein IIU29_05430, partial [Erysipelotrichaceae bacterium]|nr:hypothetical protein [Erysipelotrichaceae bacterium]
MNKKQKRNLTRILVSLALMIVLRFVPVGNEAIRFALYMVPYLIVGYDILYKAFFSVKNREP